MKHNHYEQAAQDYTEAARNLAEAHNNHQEGKDEKASQYAYAALGHRIKADEHVREASKQYSDKTNGKSKTSVK
jgi:hypothetical protein